MKREKIKLEIEESSYVIKCRPFGLCNLIQNLNESQRNDVKSIGFGGLLYMNRWSYTCWKSIFWFIRNFNPVNRLLEFPGGKHIVLTPGDIEDLFLLPRNVSKLVVSLERNDEEGSNFLAEFKRRFGLSDGATQKSIYELLMDRNYVRLNNGGDDFKRLFVFYALSTFLAPTRNFSIEFSLIKSLIEVEQISSFDWCTFVVQRLCKALLSWDEKNLKSISGCVLVLPLLYCHQFMWLGLPEECTLPLIRHWTSDKLNQRLKSEGECSFGQGKWIEGKFPISGLCKKVERVDGEDAHIDEDKFVDFEKNEPHEHMEGDRFITYKIPPDEKDDEQIKALAKNELHKSFLTLKRDFNVIMSHHMDRLSRLRDIKTRNTNKQATSSSSTPPIEEMSDSQDFWDNAEVHKYIDELVSKFQLMKALDKDDCPKFNLLSPSPSPEAKCPDIMVNNDVEIPIVSLPPSPEAKGPDFKVNDDVEILIASKDINCIKKMSDEDVKVDLGLIIVDLFHPDETDWSGHDKVQFSSTFMKKYGKYLKLSRKVKDIVDFCFHQHLPARETNVFSNPAKFYLSVKDINTLNGDCFMSSNIIDTWAFLLNKLEQYKSWKISYVTRKFYFTTQHST